MIVNLDDAKDFINGNNTSFVDGLIKLTNHEIDFKEANMICSMVKVVTRLYNLKIYTSD